MASRLKDRGGGGGKIMATKPLKAPPISDTTPKTKSSGPRKTPSSGKENAAGLRWSTSSIPRGKQSNPSSNLAKMALGARAERRSVSNLRGMDADGRLGGGGRVFEDRKVGGLLGSQVRRSVGSGARASEDRKVRGSSGSQMVTGAGRNVKKDPVFGAGVRDLSRKCGYFDSNQKAKGSGTSDPVVLLKDSGRGAGFDATLKLDGEKGINGARVLGKQIKEAHSILLEPRKENKAGNITTRIVKGKTNSAQTSVFINPRAPDDIMDSSTLSSTIRGVADFPMKEKVQYMSTADVIKVMVKGSHGSHVGTNEEIQKAGKVLDGSKDFENLNGMKSNEGKHMQVTSKYPSKLHEKLALLEGKVQRIASEIKRTKEMLDLNNQDKSKLILSDMQSKISGLEKAVGRVMVGAKSDVGSSESNDGLQIKHVVSSNELQNSVKGLNHEELEARFFPHHKLLKTRTSLGSSNERDQGSNSSMPKSIDDPNPEGRSLSPIDENPIAIEFLASIGAGQPEIIENGQQTAREEGVEKVVSSTDRCVAKKVIGEYNNEDISLMAEEKLDEFDEQENKPVMMLQEATEESCASQLFEIGCKTSTGGWFVSEGEAVLLAHDDGSCSYYDIANSEEKSVYNPPAGVSNNLWGDCWLIRAPGADGCAGRYVVAASAGNTFEAGFCSWNFYTRRILASRVEEGNPNSIWTSTSRVALAPMSNLALHRRGTSCLISSGDSRQWWYKPCGPLLISTSSRQKVVRAYDIRDGEVVMEWSTNSPVIGMEYASPLQWRSRGKVTLAESEGISLWDVNSVNAQPLLSVNCAGKKVYSLHVNNTDAELGGGVRQRVSSSEVEGHDGVFCTQDSINVFDFRLSSGIGLKMSRHGAAGHSIFSRADSIFVGSTEATIFVGSTEARLAVRSSLRSSVQQFSLRKAKLMTTYALPGSNSHFHHTSTSQVWGNNNIVMGISGMGLSVFDTNKDDAKHSINIDHGNVAQIKEIIGPDDLFHPTFDYLGSRVLVISRDRPAMWKYFL